MARSSLKNKPGERMKSIEDREEREKRQVCAGKFGCGAGGFWASHVAEGYLFFIAFALVELFVVVKIHAVQPHGVHRSVVGPIQRVIPLFEIFTVRREDEGVVVIVGVLVRVLAGDP